MIFSAVFGTIFGELFGTNYFYMDAIDLDTFNGVDTFLFNKIYDKSSFNSVSSNFCQNEVISSIWCNIFSNIFSREIECEL